MGISYNPMMDVFEVYLWQADESGRYYARPPGMAQVPDGTYAPPMLSLRPQEAQQLIDRLWQAGLRPRDGSGSSAQVEALTKHLDDMRKIVAGQLQTPLGEG
jgi:hypothetical protein